MFISTTDSKCDECGEDLGRKAWITLVEGKGALCLSCADLDHLVFLPSGSAALTRRAKKHSTLSAVVLKWSRARKRYERQGLLVEAPHSLDGNSGGQTYHGAIALCNTLDFGGYSDWRLPNLRELQSLIDYGRYYPALPLGHPFIGVQSLNYWSSTTHVGYADRAWFVYLYHGNVSLSVKSTACNVWPVRSGP